LDSFLTLCRSIQWNCWRRIQGDEEHKEADAAILRAAHDDYRRQVSPWLSIIMSTHHDDAKFLGPARNEAAKCLWSLSYGLTYVGHAVEGETLALEARQMAGSDAVLRKEISAEVGRIRAERRESSAVASAAPPPNPRERLFRGLGNSRVPVWPVLALGAAILVAVPIVIKSVGAPAWVPGTSDLRFGGNVSAGPRVRTPAAVDWDAALADVGKFGGTVSTEPPATAVPAQPQPMADGQSDAGAEPCRTSAMGGESRRPPNGKELAVEGTNEGHGKLTIINGNSEDAAVILASAETGTDDRLVYVRADSTATLDGVVPGQYRMKFQIGKDWDGQAEQFRCVSATAEFDRAASFEELEKSDGIEYTEIRITLHKLRGGNARTTRIARSAFHRRRKAS
jgi:hypothetical protein